MCGINLNFIIGDEAYFKCLFSNIFIGRGVFLERKVPLPSCPSLPVVVDSTHFVCVGGGSREGETSHQLWSLGPTAQGSKLDVMPSPFNKMRGCLGLNTDLRTKGIIGPNKDIRMK